MGACFGKSNDEQIARERQQQQTSQQQQQQTKNQVAPAANGTASQRDATASKQGLSQANAAAVGIPGSAPAAGTASTTGSAAAASTTGTGSGKSNAQPALQEQPNVIVHEDPASKKNSAQILAAGSAATAAGGAAAAAENGTSSTSNHATTNGATQQQDNSTVGTTGGSDSKPDLGDASASGVDSTNTGSTQQVASASDFAATGTNSVGGKVAQSAGAAGAVVAGAAATAATAVGLGSLTGASAATAVKQRATIYIVYYSTYGHIRDLAVAVQKGAEAYGAEVKVWQVPETLPEEVLTKMQAPAKDTTHSLIAPSDLAQADGIIFGAPTRYGQASAQMKALMDSTGQLWAKGALLGKTASIFFATATPAGGQETTAFTFITQMVHHGMIYCPIGYSNPSLFSAELHGGSPYGAGTYAGDGSRKPTELEIGVAEHQGKHFAQITTELKIGRSLASNTQ